jgi:uncharacterized protein
LVCTNAELADRDLRLAALWRPYRRTLSRTAEAWHKSEYFRRLKACGADKACILSEQETQMRRYREGVTGGGGGIGTPRSGAKTPAAIEDDVPAPFRRVTASRPSHSGPQLIGARFSGPGLA